MNEKRIIENMHKLEEKLNYHFNDINQLATAMCVDKPYNETNSSTDEYFNGSLSTVGDALLNSVLAVYFYKKGYNRTGILTEIKKPYVENSTFHKLVREEKWINYSYNSEFFYTDEQPNDKKMPDPSHDPFVEAIIAAIYFDAKEDYETIKNWILDNLYPLLKKHSQKFKNQIE